MAQCKVCQKAGWFLTLNDQGLCSTCGPIVHMAITQRVRILEDCQRIVETSKNLDTQLSRCDLAMEHLAALKVYESKGIVITTPTPSVLFQNYKKKREELIVEGLKREMADALAKANVATTVRSKQNALSKALLRVRVFIPKSAMPTMLQHMEQDLLEQISAVTLADHLDKARKAEFKGQTKKALDQYYEALYLLKHDDVDDRRQAKHIAELETKIESLGGWLKPPKGKEA